MTGELDLPDAKPAASAHLVETRVDPELFGCSCDFVGDLAETVALIWPPRPGADREPALTEVVETLAEPRPGRGAARLSSACSTRSTPGRWALLKLVTGGLRVGVSARLAKTALAEWGGPRSPRSRSSGTA